MNKTIVRFTGAALLAGLAAGGAHAADDDPLSGSVSFNSDSFFGVNPFVGLAYDTGEIDVTFYGIYWGAGTGQAFADWTEFGVGVGFEAMDGDLYINPQLGFLSGNLLSSNTGDEGVVGDGYVPNLTMNYDDGAWEGQLYAGWYLPLRDRDSAGNSTSEFLHYWVSAGKKLNDHFSVGLHFEELERTDGSNVGSLDFYQWIGPYFQVGNDTYSLRFSGGIDLEDDGGAATTNEFYKLQFGYNF